MARVKGICSRPDCDRKMDRRKLCTPHYKLTYPLQGYADPELARKHIRLLRSRGVTLDMLEALGVTRSVVARINNGRQKIHRMTEAAILALDVPPVLVSSEADVASLGTVRRVRALAALGWTQTVLASRLGWTQAVLANHIARAKVKAETAAAVDALFRELQFTLGPSQIARDRARRKGWAPPLAFDDIDDPNEIPNLGDHIHVSASERIAELQALGIRDVRQIAQRLGILPLSVERTLERSRAA